MRKQQSKAAAVTIKNAVRPFFNHPKRLGYWKPFQTLRQTVSREDLQLLYATIENNRFYPFPGLGNTFPTDRTNIPDSRLRRLTPLIVARELLIQKERLNYHSTSVSDALESLAVINGALASGDLDAAKTHIDQHEFEHGKSIIVAKKSLYHAVHDGGFSGLSEAYNGLTSDYVRWAWSMLCHVAYDLIDPTYHPVKSIVAWTDAYRKLSSESDWHRAVVEFESLGLSPSSSATAQTLLRYNALSLLDLALCLWRIGNSSTSAGEAAAVLKGLHPDILRVLEGNYRQLEIIPYPGSIAVDGISDTEIFRCACFFDDIAEIGAWRAEYTRNLLTKYLPSTDSQSLQPLTAAVISLSNGHGELNETALSLATWTKSWVNTEEVVADNGLTKRALIVGVLGRLVSEANFDSQFLTRLLSCVDDIHIYVGSDTISALSKHHSTVGDQILIFLIADVAYRQNRNAETELDRRTAFMDLFPLGQNPDFPKKLSEIWDWSSETAMHIGGMCTRTFLERLYLLMNSVRDVIESRLSVCEWMVERGSEDSTAYSEEIDALRRELANLEARSDLDSTRIHVDEDSLREWYNDTQKGKALRFIQTVLSEGQSGNYPTFLAFYARYKELQNEGTDDFSRDAQIGSEFILLEIVEATLRAFASDRTFGLDAYLSRRIRHGTLSGTLLTPVNRVRRKLEDALTQFDASETAVDTQPIRDAINAWYGHLVAAIDEARREIIQIRSNEHPNGLIQATWTHGVNVAHLDAMIARARTRIVQSSGVYDLFSDLHSLCWDCLEADLAQLRLYLSREFFREIVVDLRTRFDELEEDQQRLSGPYMYELQQVFEGRVREICGWFIRPVFRRDQYSLENLINSTLSLVRELDDSYLFSEEVVLAGPVTLNRGGFEVFGDALFVLIGNAAKHSRSEGKVKVRAGYLSGESGAVVICVTSEASDPKDFENAMSRIKSALTVEETGALDAAAVGEGFSGLRKLSGILQKVRGSEVALLFRGNPTDLTISFEAVLPDQIIFRRERS